MLLRKTKSDNGNGKECHTLKRTFSAVESKVLKAITNGDKNGEISVQTPGRDYQYYH